MVRQDIFSYKTKPYIKDKFDLDDPQYYTICEPFIHQRAEMLISNLTKLSEDIPIIIRTAISKLTIISFVAAKLNPPVDIRDITTLEKIENCAIKAELLNDNTWKDIGMHKEELPITPEWVIMVESATLPEQLKLAESIRDKIGLKDHVKDPMKYDDWDAHVSRCNHLHIDPTKHSEKDVMSMEKRMKQFEDIDNT